MNPVFLREAFGHIVLVLSNAFNEVAGDADVEHSVASAGKDVDSRLHGLPFPCEFPHPAEVVRRGIQDMKNREYTKPFWTRESMDVRLVIV